MIKPYTEEKIGDWFYRTFTADSAIHEMVWHRDREDRIVEPIGTTDWKIQLENNLPQLIQGQIFVPKGEWHRAIKGTGDLKIKIKKL